MLQYLLIFCIPWQNDVQTSDYTYEFDLLLLDNTPATPFELATVQAGILVNASIYNGGTIFGIYYSRHFNPEYIAATQQYSIYPELQYY